MSDEQLSLSVLERDYSDHLAWPSFKLAVKGNNVKYPEILTLWYYYTAGWKALENKLNAEATNWWCNYNG